MTVANPNSYFFKAREFWANKGRPKSMFDDAGAFGKTLSKGVDARWQGKGIAQLAVEYNEGGNAGADFSAAILYSGDDEGEQFQIPIAELWSMFQANWDLLELMKQPGWGLDNQAAQVTKQMRRMKAWMKSLSYTVWGDGTARLARGDGAYDPAVGLVATLKNRNTANRFNRNDIVVFVDGLTTRPGQLKVSSVNRETGQITFTSVDGSPITNISDANGIPGATNNDWLAKAVDRAAVTTGRIMLGFYSWVPKLYADAVTTFLGVGRDKDVERLAGKRIRLTGSETPWTVVQKIANRASKEGIPINMICIPDHLWDQFENEYRGYLAVDPPWMTTGGDARKLTFGISGIKYMRPGREEPIMITSDIYLNDPDATEADDYTFVGLRMEDWNMITTPTGVDWWDMTGTGKLQQIVGSQQVLGVYGCKGNVKTEHPGHNIVAGPTVTVS
jgi:hypothetical protein